jgi:Protein of unknown function (DUF3102)
VNIHLWAAAFLAPQSRIDLMSDTTKPKPESGPVPPEPTPEQIAESANREYLAIIADQRGSNHNIVERAIKVGAQLIYCKGKVAHGNWVPWGKTNCPQISKSTVERWMKLAENKEKIAAEIKERNSKNSTVTFLTLREALTIANGSGDGGGSGPTYDSVEARLLKQLEPMNHDTADAAVANTIRKLKAAVAQKKAA